MIPGDMPGWPAPDIGLRKRPARWPPTPRISRARAASLATPSSAILAGRPSGPPVAKAGAPSPLEKLPGPKVWYGRPDKIEISARGPGGARAPAWVHRHGPPDRRDWPVLGERPLDLALVLARSSAQRGIEVPSFHLAMTAGSLPVRVAPAKQRREHTPEANADVARCPSLLAPGASLGRLRIGDCFRARPPLAASPRTLHVCCRAPRRRAEGFSAVAFQFPGTGVPPGGSPLPQARI